MSSGSASKARVPRRCGSGWTLNGWLHSDCPEEVEVALARNNFLAAIGQAKGGAVQVDLLADTDLRSVEEFERLIVREDADRSFASPTSARSSWARRRRAPTSGTTARMPCIVGLAVAGRQRDRRCPRAQGRACEIADALPPGTEIDLAYDGTVYMENALKEIFTTFSETIMIVALIVFLFWVRCAPRSCRWSRSRSR